MIVDLGYLSLFMALSLTIYSMATSILGIRSNSTNLLISAKLSTLLIFIFVALAYLSLTYSFLVDDFSVSFVANHSSTDLPIFYKVTAVWGGMDGSLLLWTFLLAGYSFAIVFLYKNKKNIVVSYSTIFLNVILTFLLFLLVGWSNPLARAFPIVGEGQGLNPLLQDPAMIIHPPLLYLGFIGLSIPFSFAIGSLVAGKVDNNWIKMSRRWTLAAWFFLTLGMIIGGQWAYYELGWGGYWAWDPVENSSLLPWLGATAFLHSAMVQEKRNVLKIWNYILIIITFTLTIIGTFITRSGVLNSVHAFAQSKIGPSFLVFAAIVLLFCFTLLFYRLPLLENKTKLKSFFCKENSFLLNNILLMGICFAVFYGTIFPLIAEGLANRKISVQAPFFNQLSLPLVVILITLMGTAPFLAWNKANLSKLRANLLLPLIVSILIMVVCGLFLNNQIQFILFAGAVYFSGHSILLELYKTYSYGKKRMKEKRRPWSEIFADRRGWGAMIIHLGIVIFAVGVLGNFFNQEKSLTIKPNQKIDFQNYELFYTGAKFEQILNAQHQIANFQLFKNEKLLTELNPSKAFYLTTNEPTTEAAIFRSLIKDFYISLASINRDGSATITIYINYLVLFIPLSLIFFLVGILLSFSYTSPYFNNYYESKKYA